MDGYELFAQGKLVTIFSAPNHREFGNAGGVMLVDEKTQFSFSKFTNFKSVKSAAKIV